MYKVANFKSQNYSHLSYFCNSDYRWRVEETHKKKSMQWVKGVDFRANVSSKTNCCPIPSTLSYKRGSPCNNLKRSGGGNLTCSLNNSEDQYWRIHGLGLAKDLHPAWCPLWPVLSPSQRHLPRGADATTHTWWGWWTGKVHGKVCTGELTVHSSRWQARNMRSAVIVDLLFWTCLHFKYTMQNTGDQCV